MAQKGSPKGKQYACHIPIVHFVAKNTIHRIKLLNMNERWWYLITGVIIGWAFKIPFFIKYYRRIKKMKDYERKMHIERLEKNIKDS